LSELRQDITPEDGLFKNVNVSALSNDARRSILEAVKNKFEFNEAYETLGIAKSGLHRYLSGKRRIPEDVARRALHHLTRSEFESIVSDWDRLRALGLVKEDGAVDYGLVLKILAVASRDEYLKNAILQFVVQEFRDDLRRMLGISLVGVKLEWSDDFEHFLMERKKRRVRSVETLRPSSIIKASSQDTSKARSSPRNS